MGVDTILLATATAISAKSSLDNAKEAKKARKAQEKLEKERSAQLAEEAIARRRSQEKAATSGQRAGLGARSSFLSGIGNTGMGAPTAPPISARGTLFGN